MNLQLNKNAFSLNLIPVNDMVIFPGMIASFFISNSNIISLVQKTIKNTNIALISLSKNNNKDNNNTPQNVENIGCLVEILQVIHINEGTIKVFVKGINRVQLTSISSDNFLKADYVSLEDSKIYKSDILSETRESLLTNLNNYINITKKVPNSLLLSLKKVEDLNATTNAICAHLPISPSEKQYVLSITDLLERVAYVNSLLEVELDLINLEKKIRDRVKQQMEKNQKDYYLNEQVKAIQKELNNGEDVKEEAKEFLNKAKSIKLTAEATEKVEGEIKKLSMMNPISAEATVVRNYIDWILTLPWNSNKTTKIDLTKAESFLDEGHYALGKVKERILEYLAVLKKSKLLKAPILCLVGPPGVGKTSLAKSIAKASGREFTRISLGGVRDEAEIRGHRRTYIGAMPGKIIQSMKKSKVSNPLFLLDEVDKMGSDYRGDPASALLEVLDPEQNVSFVDHYLEVEYDLSNVMFITTANSLNIPDALLDRMEVIELSGYSEEEKLEIAKRHLLPKKMKEAALVAKEFKITDEAIITLIRNYTRESGVRELERIIAMVCRRTAKEIVQKEVDSVVITKENTVHYAGVPKFKDSAREKEDLVGVTTGLAWTRVGGDTLYIEAIKIPGKGNIQITGKLGEVMQESVKAAHTLIQSHAKELGLNKDSFKAYDIHLHVPEGATPKDGPSAGVAMITSIFSVLSNIKVRRDVAMTGEITLRGKVLPIGGVREKLLAALRAGIKTVLIPIDNAKDLADLPKSSLKQLNIIFISNFKEVLRNALVDTSFLYTAKDNKILD